MSVTKFLSIISISLCVLLLCNWVVADTEEAEGPSDVLVLTTENFQETISASPLIAVEFYSPWCGHCKSLAPEWEKAATALKGKVPVAKVDCTAQGDICDENEVQGYPTLKLFREGEASPMEVARKSEAIVAFLTKETEPAVKVLKTSAELDEFIAAHPLTVVGYLDNDHDDRWAVFKEVALKKRHTLDFVAIINAEWAAHTSPSVVLHKNFEEPKVVYSGEFVGPAISTWVSRSILPTLGEISVDTFPNYVAADLSVLGYLFVDPNDETTAAFLKEVESKLAAYKDDFKVAWINNNKYAQQATRLGLGSKIPSIVLDNHMDGVKFIFPEDQTITSEALGEWFAQYKAGSLKPHVKSEPIPETNDGPVKVLVAHTFKDIVYDETKDVLVEFYAPWCGHCKSLAPTWEQLGSLFADAPSVVIAKVDATANDVPPKLNIRGFPTIIFFPANSKDTPVEYQGTRSLEDLAKFVRDNAATKIGNVGEVAAQEEAEHDDDEHDHEGCDHDHSHDHEEEAKPADKDEL